MRRWNLTREGLISLTLAADVRCGATDYSDDQIWELNLEAGEPPAIALRTTFGLRARSMRLFPRFVIGDREVSDPQDFARSPVLRNFYPNFARLDFSPFPDIDVTVEIWVPQSHAILGRFWLHNQSASEQSMRLELAAVLSPVEGQRMADDQIEGTSVLSGQTGNLSPLVFMTGGAHPGRSPYPSLVRDIELPPGEVQCSAWSHTACGSSAESFDLARQLNALPWEAHIAQIEMINAGQVEIYTGNSDWDLALALSQCLSHSFFVGPTDRLPEPSFVSTRRPDQGFSLRGDGSDYNHLWSGQTPLDACLLAGYLLPGSPELLKAVLINFLESQKEDGFIDLKPGLGGQRSRAMATPLLATTTWQYIQSQPEGDLATKNFIQQVYPALLSFFDAWFNLDFDADQDGLPEWSHPMQTGLEEHPLFSVWQPWSQGADIRTSESPALASMLYCECRALQQMAKLLGEVKDLAHLKTTSERLRALVYSMWDETTARHQYRDRDSHLTAGGQQIAEQTGPGTLDIHQQFEIPVRLVLKINANGETRPQPRIFIHGENASGQHRIERIEAEQVRWSLDYGILTGDRLYNSIEKVELQGLLAQDVVTLSSAGYDCHDITLLLPLWAGLPTTDQAKELVERNILEETQYWRSYGLPACGEAQGGDQNTCDSVHMIFNSLIGQGLLAYGYREEAAELVSRLMAGIVQNLKRDGTVRRSFNAQDGEGNGERNALGGLAPLGLFMEVLGIRLISPLEIYLTGFNPFPWPVTVKYRGTTILRQKDKTVVIFPDGQTVETSNETAQLVRLQL